MKFIIWAIILSLIAAVVYDQGTSMKFEDEKLMATLCMSYAENYMGSERHKLMHWNATKNFTIKYVSAFIENQSDGSSQFIFCHWSGDKLDELSINGKRIYLNE